jgi:hypothetical protein
MRKRVEQQIGFARIDGDKFGQSEVSGNPQRVRFFPAWHPEEKSRQMMERSIFSRDRFARPQCRSMFGGELQPVDCL